jgi:uncharacterized membrane protein
VLIAQSLSKGFRTKLENFKRDQKMIKDHYLKDFKLFYYGVLGSRMITFGFYIYFFSLKAENLEAFSTIFYFVTYSFIVVGFMDLAITLYIIFFKNTPVIEVAANVCYNCFSKRIPMLGALHVSSNVPFIAPNPVSNWYHKHTYLGRGYGAWSSGPLLQVDYIKTQLGGEFDYQKVIDQHKMLDPKKIKEYSEQHNISYKNLLSLTKPK